MISIVVYSIIRYNEKYYPFELEEDKMETSYSKIIFAQKFPDARPAAMLKKAEELSSAVPADKKTPPPPFEDMVRRIKEAYTYEPRPDAEKTSAIFIFLAIRVCRNFEIDTTITRREHAIDVTMDLYCGWHSRDITRAFAAVLRLADDFTLSTDPNDPEYVRVSMTYHTHNRYSHGEKVDWQ